MIIYFGALAILLPLLMGFLLWRHFEKFVIPQPIEEEYTLRFFLKKIGIISLIVFLSLYILFSLLFTFSASL